MILESLLGGGLTGVIGSVISNITDIWKRRQERQHEIALKKLDMQVMDKEWEYRERQAETEGAVQIQESSDDLRAESYKHDVIRYASGLNVKSVWLKALLVMVDVIRGMVRPALTLFLIWLVWDTRMEIEAVITQSGGVQAIDPGQAAKIYQSIVQMILYLAAVCVTWWFGTRPQKEKKV